MNRPALVAMVHIARKDLGLDDGAYRAVLERVTGASSAKELDARQLGRVADEFRRLGWKPKAGSRGKRSEKAYVRLIWVLWGKLAKAGAVKTRSKRIALRTFVHKLTGVTEPEWLDPAQGTLVIESMKQWLARLGAEV